MYTDGRQLAVPHPIVIIGGYDIIEGEDTEMRNEENERQNENVNEDVDRDNNPSVSSPNADDGEPVADLPPTSPLLSPSPSPPNSPQPDTRTHEYLSIVQLVATPDETLVKYQGVLVNVEDMQDELSDYEILFRRFIRPSLVSFYQSLLERAPSVKVWSQMNVLFTRTLNDGTEDQIDFPMRAPAALLLDPSHSALDLLASSQVENMIERCAMLQRTGSNFTFHSFQTAIFNVSFVQNSLLNSVGASTSAHTHKLFGSNSKNHLNSKRKLPLRRHISGICSDKSDCFLLALGASALRLSKPEIDQANQKSLKEHANFKAHLISAAHQHFDLRGLGYPASIAEITNFQKNNEALINLNIYAFAKKLTSRPYYTIFPFLIAKEPRHEIPTLNLMISRQVTRGSTDQIGYHINVIYGFAAMMRASMPRGFDKAFCPMCCMPFQSRTVMESHKPHCQKLKTRLVFPPRSTRQIFEAQRKKSLTACLFTFDIETCTKSDSSVSFGPKSSKIKSLNTMAVGMTAKFLLHPLKYDPILPKIFLGPDSMQQFIQHLHFESFYVQSILRQDSLPMKPLTDEEKALILNCNSCGNCQKHLNPEDKRLHHCHACSFFQVGVDDRLEGGGGGSRGGAEETVSRLFCFNFF